jgi:hypothetical protein
VPHLEVPEKEFKDGFVGVSLEAGKDEKIVRYLVPTAGYFQLGDTAHALHRVAQALNDVELEALARWQAQWAIGHNPFNVSFICRFGEDSIDQFYSFSQGRMPGCVSGFGLGNDGVPQCVRPYGGESWTSPGVRLLRALIAVSEPARLRLTLRNDGKPWQGEIVIRWPITGEAVFTGKTDAHGALPELKLDGGQRYELACGGVALPLSLTSGTTHERTVDLGRVLVLSADAPRQVKPNAAFAVTLSVANRGLKPTSAKVAVYAEDAATEQSTQMVELSRGETKAISWPFKASEADRPYILFFELDGDHATGLDVTGAILP